MEEEDLPPLQKIAISGPSLTSIIQRFSSSSGDVDGLLYGHITSSSPILQDDVVLHESSSSSSSDSSSSTSIATITGFFCSGTILSFYNSLGQLNLSLLQKLTDSQSNQNQTLIGWFVGRRRTCLRPSMREFSVCKSLNTKNTLVKSVNLLPVFMIFGTPAENLSQTIHTHDYKAFQFRRGRLEGKTVDIVNIGPAFRGHYDDFAPNTRFPLLPGPFKGDGMEIGDERSKGSLSELKEREKGQRKLDNCVQGFEVGRLSKLMGMTCTQEVEALYEAMLMKLEGLARVVEKSNEKVFEQEVRIGKMRKKFAGLE